MINIILYQPEKPSNVGNIMRTVACTDSKLIIIGPLSFKLDDDSLKRAGMDYLIGLNYEYIETLDEFFKKYHEKEIFYITRYGKQVYSNANLTNKDIYVMFGRESSGIPYDLLANNIDRCLRLPMKVDSRSLNLSNCVAIITYEILRQQNFNDLATLDYLKGEDFLENHK